MTMPRAAFAFPLLLAAEAASAAGPPPAFVEPRMLEAEVAAGRLPPVAQRLPEVPDVASFDDPELSIGRHGGRLRLLMASPKDVRMMVVYGYARLVGYDRDLNLAPDILLGIDVAEDRIFTLRLRPGHRWSDGHPFTAEDFRFYWEDIATNKQMSPAGLPTSLVVRGEGPRFEVLDAHTVRYSWSRPNPFFLPDLAGAAPLFIYRPAHYLKQYHARYADPETLKRRIKEQGQRNWVALQTHMGRQYRIDNPDMPTLDPWVLRTKPPADRFVFQRNPYYHRVDGEGRQLPYIDEVDVIVANAKLIPAKAGSGEADLQARYLHFNNYTFLKQGEKTNGYRVRLWQAAKGSQVALFPNLNTTDPEWRALFRNADFRRALSLAINRREINQVIYFGLALEGNNTVLPRSPLFKPEYRTRWATHDPNEANRLLDGLGLAKRDDRGVRLLPDGRPMEIIVETAGEETEQTDVLELIRESWKGIGVKLFAKPLQREVFRNRIFAGSTLMSVWSGLENGVPTADSPPSELAPTSQDQYQWPKWGQYVATNGMAGEPADLEPAKRLAELNEAWTGARGQDERRKIWHQMLHLYVDQVFSIGLVYRVPQPVVVSNRLRNVPLEGVYNWDPGAHFGIYRPDTFWFRPDSAEAAEKS
jgi:peptide/nickel transport system substrate-binding protein